MLNKVKIVIVEDNKAVKDGYELILNSYPKYVVERSYFRAEDAIRNYKRDKKAKPP